MGQSINIVGLRAPEEQWKKMKAVWDACRAADVAPPKEVDRYFEGEPPDPGGVRVAIERHECVREYNADMCDGYEVEIAKLPPGVTHVRFWNSY